MVLSLLINIFIAIVMMWLMYNAFEESGFFKAFIICYIASIINSIINAILTSDSFSFLSFFIGIIICLIETAIYSVVYNKSNSFKQFIIKSILTFIAIYAALILTVAGITLIFNNNSNDILSNHNSGKEEKVVNCGTYEIGTEIEFNESHKLVVKNIATRFFLSKNDVTYYPERDNCYVLIQYYINKGDKFTSLRPRIVFEDKNKNQYSELKRIKDSITGKSIDAELIFSNDSKTAFYAIYELPKKLVNSENLYMCVTEGHVSLDDILLTDRYNINLNIDE